MSALQEQLMALIDLQKVDLEIAALRKAGETYPRQMSELDRELTAAKAALEAERNRLADIERQKRDLESNIAEEKEKVRKWEARLAEQRSSREYAALAREIDIAKKANATMGEELGELGKQQNAARETVKAKEGEFQGKAEQINARIAELKGKLAEVEGQVKAIDERRNAAATKVDANLLRRYETVRKKRTPAMCGARAPGVCLGCNMNVRPQLYNTLRTTMSTDVCPSCGRIIYAAEVLEAPAAK